MQVSIWAVVKELKLSDKHKEALLLNLYPFCGNLFQTVGLNSELQNFRLLNSNPNLVGLELK